LAREHFDLHFRRHHVRLFTLVALGTQGLKVILRVLGLALKGERDQMADMKLHNFVWKLVMGLTRHGSTSPTRGVVPAEHSIGNLFINTPIGVLNLVGGRQAPLFMGQPNGFAELVLVIHEALVPL
jgi:hypothetical protein